MKGTFSSTDVSLTVVPKCLSVTLGTLKLPSLPRMTHFRGRMRLQSAATEHISSVNGSPRACARSEALPHREINVLEADRGKEGGREREIKTRELGKVRMWEGESEREETDVAR